MTKAKIIECEKPLLIDLEGLKALTGCGRYSAIKIGSDAKACVRIGRTVRWNVAKVKAYIDEISNDGKGEQ